MGHSAEVRRNKQFVMMFVDVLRIEIDSPSYLPFFLSFFLFLIRVGKGAWFGFVGVFTFLFSAGSPLPWVLMDPDPSILDSLRGLLSYNRVDFCRIRRRRRKKRT